MARELGLERCETVRILSLRNGDNCENLWLVWKDRQGKTNGEPIVFLNALLGSYVLHRELLKASKQETFF